MPRLSVAYPPPIPPPWMHLCTSLAHHAHRPAPARRVAGAVAERGTSKGHREGHSRWYRERHRGWQRRCMPGCMRECKIECNRRCKRGRKVQTRRRCHHQGRCIICGGPGISDAYYCKECTQQEKDVRRTRAHPSPSPSFYPLSPYAPERRRSGAQCGAVVQRLPESRARPTHALLTSQRDGCPKIVNLGSSKTDLFYERKKYCAARRILLAAQPFASPARLTATHPNGTICPPALTWSRQLAATRLG